MTVWELKELCIKKINDDSLSEQQRNAYKNALQSANKVIEEIENDKRGNKETIR